MGAFPESTTITILTVLSRRISVREGTIDILSRDFDHTADVHRAWISSWIAVFTVI
jgi:hypothetical protein